MTSIQEFLAQSKTTSRKESIPPAIHPSKVKKVILDTRYKDDAIIITYELYSDKKTYQFEERFIKNKRFERTRKFFEYLADNGIINETDFVGCHEELDLRWNFTRTGKRELTIVNRTFIGFDDEDIASSDADETVVTADA